MNAILLCAVFAWPVTNLLLVLALRRDAKRRNVRVLFWAIGTFLFGVLAVPLWVFIRPPMDGTAKRGTLEFILTSLLLFGLVWACFALSANHRRTTRRRLETAAAWNDDTSRQLSERSSRLATAWKVTAILPAVGGVMCLVLMVGRRSDREKEATSGAGPLESGRSCAGAYPK